MMEKEHGGACADLVGHASLAIRRPVSCLAWRRHSPAVLFSGFGVRDRRGNSVSGSTVNMDGESPLDPLLNAEQSRGTIERSGWILPHLTALRS
jgi:hypothetical protein